MPIHLASKPMTRKGHYSQRPTKIFSQPLTRARNPQFTVQEPESSGQPKGINRAKQIKAMPEFYRSQIIREMKLRGLSENSISVYLDCLKLFMHQFSGRKPTLITLPEIENYVLELMSRGQSHRYINIQITAIRFFYVNICKPCFHVADLPKLKERRKLPKIFSRTEVLRIIESASNVRSKCMLTLLYSTGMRAGELTSLRVADIDLEQMLVFIGQGKGEKQRYVPLARKALPILKEYMRRRSPQNEYLFANESSLYGEAKGKIGSENVIKIFAKAKKSPKFYPLALATA